MILRFCDCFYEPVPEEAQCNRNKEQPWNPISAEKANKLNSSGGFLVDYRYIKKQEKS